MKPRLLEIQAFGPYLKKTTIDFTPLYANGLFLITGSTGSGKTTILDAMSFALYGLATGAVRDCRDMRNIAAPRELETKVTFEMELSGEIFKFSRSITIKLKNKRDGTQEERIENEANCYKMINSEWKLIASSTQVSLKAEELLGFSHQQFSQVVVLPQGEFRKLLIASSKDKQEILKKLFGTQRFENFSYLLSQKSKNLKVDLIKCRDKEKTLCENVECETTEQLFSKIEETNILLLEAEKKREVCKADYLNKNGLLKSAETLQMKFTELEELEKRQKDLTANKNEIDAKRNLLKLSEKANKVLPYYNAENEAKKALTDAETKFNTAKKKLTDVQNIAQKAEENAKNLEQSDLKIQEMSNEISKLDVVMKSSQELKTARDQIKSIQNELQNHEKISIELKAKKEQLESKILSSKEKIEYISENYISKLPDMVKKESELQLAFNNLSKCNRAKDDFEKAESILKEKISAFRLQDKQFKNEEAIFEHQQKIFDEDSAFKLSQNLGEGEPCPVCGSLNHPSLAKAVGEAKTKVELDEQKEIVAKLKIQLEKATDEGKTARAECNSKEKIYNELKKECDKYSFSFDELSKLLDNITLKVKEATTQSENQKQLKDKLAKLEEAQIDLNNKIDSAEKDKNSVKEKLSSFEGKIAELLKSVGEKYSNIEILQAEIETKKGDYLALSAQVKKTREELQTSKNELIKAEENEKNTKLTLENAKISEAKKSSELKTYLKECFEDQEVNITELIIDDKTKLKFDKLLKDYDEEVLVVLDGIKKLSKELQKVENPNLSKIKEEEKQAFDLLQEQLNLTSKLETMQLNYKNISTQLKKIKEETDKLSQEFSLYDRIAQFSSGVNPKKTPIGQFVLGLMLQDIVASANIHLNKFSSGRYSLVKSEDISRGNGSKGLELSVNDSWSGKERSVSTLSGGEMFLASLSLAFGLSDVVQSYSGGIRLDSLFIDEGFGSLDSETLEISMNALESLRTSGRLIGVISHVSELSDRIHDKINVEKNSDSSATVTVEIA